MAGGRRSSGAARRIRGCMCITLEPMNQAPKAIDGNVRDARRTRLTGCCGRMCWWIYIRAFKQGMRASVEEYSLKKVEAFYGFERRTPLEESRAAMRYVEHRLELGWRDEELPETVREVMEGYNREDCLSALGPAGLA